MDLQHQLTPRLKRLRLSGILETLEVRNQQAIAEKWSYVEFLTRLAEDEVERRDHKQLTLRLRRATVNTGKTLESFDFAFNPSINRQQVLDLATSLYVQQKRNVLVCGPTGVGKPQPIHYPYRCDVHSGAIRYRRRSPSPALWPHAALGRHHAETLPWSLLRRLAPPRRRTSRAGQCD